MREGGLWLRNKGPTTSTRFLLKNLFRVKKSRRRANCFHTNIGPSLRTSKSTVLSELLIGILILIFINFWFKGILISNPKKNA